MVQSERHKSMNKGMNKRVPIAKGKGTDRQASLLQRRAYNEVKRLLISGEFEPGSFLSERQLSLRLGMSKTPVHVALKRLELEGFLSVSPQQGVVVRVMSIQEIVEHYEMRQAIESFVVRKLAGKLSNEQIERLHDSLAEQSNSLLTEVTPRSVELDANFHLALTEFVANSQLTRLMEQSRERIHQVIFRAVELDPQRMRDSLEEHTRIVEAIIQGDATRSSELMTEHLERGKQRHLALHCL